MLAGFLLLLGSAVLLVGRYPASGIASPSLLWDDPLFLQVFMYLRLPRVLTAILGGAVLGAAGCVFQMIFSNPLVEPGFLGVSQGAAFGAAFSILFITPSQFSVQITATIFALAGLFLSYYLARKFHFGGWILRLVLAGIAVSALFSSGVGFLKYIADPVSQLPDITFWLLGSLAGSNWTKLTSIAPVSVISLGILFLFRWRLNILSLQDRSAFSLGARPQWEKLLLLFCATASAAAVISVSGLVGWIGLIVPHIARKALTSDARFALPGSMLMGSIYFLASDTAARAFFTGEIPLGIITSAVGAFLFILILTRKDAGESL